MGKQKKKKQNAKQPILILLLAVIGILAVLYVAAAVYFKSHFFPNSTINGCTVSGLDAGEADAALALDASDYLLTIFDRDGGKYHLTGRDFDYSYKMTGSAGQYLEKQNAFLWPFQLASEKNYTMEASVSYDAQKLETQILALGLFDEGQMVAPVNACLIQSDDGYEVQEEVSGNTPDTEHMVNTILAAVAAGQSSVTLTDEDYLAPDITTDDPALAETISNIDRYLAAAITLETYDGEEILNQDIIKKWIVVDEDGSVTIDEQKVTAYVQSLASKYNTYADKRQFVTSAGDTVTIGGGDYGWIVDKDTEKEAILSDLETGAPVSRPLHYLQEAFQEGADDIGGTYVEIDYTNQHLWYYIDGALQCESDIVSGNINRGNGSPDGVFKIVYKASPATLTGEDYSSDVTFFMPFAYNVGIHDASWRSSFGGTLYQSSGSHGCINVPYETASRIYELIEVGTPVIAYYREPVTLTAENARISNAYSYVDPNAESGE